MPEQMTEIEWRKRCLYAHYLHNLGDDQALPIEQVTFRTLLDYYTPRRNLPCLPADGAALDRQRMSQPDMQEYRNLLYYESKLPLARSEGYLAWRRYTERPPTAMNIQVNFNLKQVVWAEQKFQFEETVEVIQAAAVRTYWIEAHKKFGFHPAIEHLIAEGEHNARDITRLVLELPHVSEEDPKKLAYIQTEQKGMRGLYTRTTIGKYLGRHFPTLTEKELNSISNFFANPSAKFDVLRDMRQMIEATQTGPWSCMQKSDWAWEEHPYRVYDPRFGWGLAVERDMEGKVIGRALVFEGTGEPCFVRTYAEAGDRTNTDSKSLHAWLLRKGYNHRRQWPTKARLLAVSRDGLEAPIIEDGTAEVVMPYFDGNTVPYIAHYGPTDEPLVVDAEGKVTDSAIRAATYDDGEDEVNGKYLRYFTFTTAVSASSASLRTYTEGERSGRAQLKLVDEKACEYTCACCGDGIDTVTFWAGTYEDDPVGGCCEDYYVHALSRGGDRRCYHEDDDSIIHFDGDYYHQDYLSHNGIVALDRSYRGEHYAAESDTVTLESGDTCHQDDPAVVYIDAEGSTYYGEYVYAEDTWVCEYDGQTYHDDDDFEETTAGRVFHDNYEDWKAENEPDPETDDEDGAADEAATATATEPGAADDQPEEQPAEAAGVA